LGAGIVSSLDPIRVYFTVPDHGHLDFHRRYSTRATLGGKRKKLKLAVGRLPIVERRSRT
jgi:hypothetical protein